jgi:hypothetical protein
MPLDDLSQKTHSELETVAAKHPTFKSFMQEVERLAETVWHNARAKGHDPRSIVGDASSDDGVPDPPQSDDGDNTEGDGGQPVTTPAEPASPSSEAGFPTTNVDVVTPESQPVQPSP